MKSSCRGLFILNELKKKKEKNKFYMIFFTTTFVASAFFKSSCGRLIVVVEAEHSALHAVCESDLEVNSGTL